jgi:peptide/nickel transport system substrate-binding protein
VTGWLPAEDPLYRNYSTSDNYVAIQLLSGVLKKAEGSDGTIRTATTYAQPPNAGLGFYSLNSIQQSFNSPTFHMTFPPLFWYVQDNGTYSSTGGVGDSYSISEATG